MCTATGVSDVSGADGLATASTREVVSVRARAWATAAVALPGVRRPVAVRRRFVQAYGLQLKALPTLVPVQAPGAHPAQIKHAPLGHCESLVHQQGTPAAVHMPLGDDTSLQLPMEHDHALATDVAVSQSSLSFGALPVHVPVHWALALTHLPLEQSESATQRHAV
jgi:hypothetical protein